MQAMKSAMASMTVHGAPAALQRSLFASRLRRGVSLSRSPSFDRMRTSLEGCLMNSLASVASKPLDPPHAASRVITLSPCPRSLIGLTLSSCFLLLKGTRGRAWRGWGGGWGMRRRGGFGFCFFKGGGAAAEEAAGMQGRRVGREEVEARDGGGIGWGGARGAMIGSWRRAA